MRSKIAAGRVPPYTCLTPWIPFIPPQAPPTTPLQLWRSKPIQVATHRCCGACAHPMNQASVLSLVVPVLPNTVKA